MRKTIVKSHLRKTKRKNIIVKTHDTNINSKDKKDIWDKISFPKGKSDNNNKSHFGTIRSFRTKEEAEIHINDLRNTKGRKGQTFRIKQGNDTTYPYEVQLKNYKSGFD